MLRTFLLYSESTFRVPRCITGFEVDQTATGAFSSGKEELKIGE